MKNQKLSYSCMILGLLLYAWFVREWAYHIDSLFGKTILQLTRHLIHIGLILGWEISIYRRILQHSVRSYLLAAGGFLAFWLYIRTLKWMFFPALCWQSRYLWYGYYLPLILVPLFGVFLVQYLGKKESFELSWKTKLLYVPAFFLIGLVFTNDLHQLVFLFPSGKPFSDRDYHYGIGYFLIAAWCLLLSVYFVVQLIRKCRAPGKKWAQKLPLAVLLAALFFSVLYCLHIVKADLTAVDCIIIILLLESCIQSGLIRSNSGYDAIFEAALLEALISDQNGNLCYLSKQAKKMEESARELMKDSKNQGIIFKNRRLNCVDITNGKVFWWENVAEIFQYTQKQKELQEKLSEENDLLEAEIHLRESQLRVNEKNRLYDRLSGEVKEQLIQLEALLNSTSITGTRRIARICVLSAYMKRRCNLCLLSEDKKVIPLAELEFCLSESLDNLRLCGISCSLNSHCAGKTRSTLLIFLYDVVQQIFQQLLPLAGAILLTLHGEENSLFLKLQTDAPIEMDFPQLTNWIAAGGTFSLEVKEDTTWLTLKTGEPL